VLGVAVGAAIAFFRKLELSRDCDSRCAVERRVRSSAISGVGAVVVLGKTGR
jgi:hypothetical protein